MQTSYIPIYKVAQLSEDGEGAVDQLAARHPYARRTTDKKHVVFCEATRDLNDPVVAEHRATILYQQHILDWLELEDSVSALYVTVNELHLLDAANLLGPIEESIL